MSEPKQDRDRDEGRPVSCFGRSGGLGCTIQKVAAISDFFSAGSKRPYQQQPLKCDEAVTRDFIDALSYPTIKSRLARIADSLEFVETNPTPTKAEILERLHRGEISAEQAIREMEALQ